VALEPDEVAVAGTALVGQQGDSAVALAEFAHGLGVACEPAVVLHDAVLDGRVEVDPHQDGRTGGKVV